MSKNKRHVILGTGIPCPKCDGKTETRKGTNHGKSFYFSQYDYCWRCKAVFFNEKYKVLASGVFAQKKFDIRIKRKQERKLVPEHTKTEQEIADAKRAYGAWRAGLNNVMANLRKVDIPADCLKEYEDQNGTS